MQAVAPVPECSGTAGGATLALAFGFEFADLYRQEGLEAIDRAFLDFAGAADAALRDRLVAARASPEALPAKDESELILDLAPHLERFVAVLFGIVDEVAVSKHRHDEQAPLFAVKRQFVQRRTARIGPDEARGLDGPALERELRHVFGGRFDELTYASHVERWLQDEPRYASELDLALRYAAWALHSQAGREHTRRGVLFKTPAKLDPQNLIEHVERIAVQGATAYRIDAPHLRRREGFQLTDPGTTLVHALDQANYCIECHKQGKDSCSKGLREKASAAARDPIAFRKSALGATLAGCPLEEKISEFQSVKARGYAIGALAVICIDNPMCAATGHRICNDCMKACIYQKQDPVDTPQIETRTLRDVLALPWGFEIYSLLTRWNPLNLRQPLPRPASGKRALVVGM
ncbi:MAG: pyridine nucleotide-disulfide oxidoreductase, partial [Proteobacteria bacterium]|nr:pyridine nucleotide-disulfide oxidoreductase [Pseudomonadota bacterium]